jgi:hypothetical protein
MKYLRQIRKQRLFWLTVSEVAVHGQMAPLLYGLWQGRNHMAEEAHLIGAKKLEQAEGVWDSISPSRAHPQ